MSVDHENQVMVFKGSSPEDVSHARLLWSSESRLVSADSRQRLPVSRPQRGASAAPGSARPVQDPDVWDLRQRQEERRRFEAMADRRKEILALLRRQREERIQKELLSAAVKPSRKPQRDPEDPDSELDRELVKQLQ